MLISKEVKGKTVHEISLIEENLNRCRKRLKENETKCEQLVAEVEELEKNRDLVRFYYFLSLNTVIYYFVS